MGPNLRAAFERELASASRFIASGDWERAWRSLERAHVLSQRSTRAHVRAHGHMLRFAWLRHDWREVLGQLSRIVGAALFSRIWIPEGNTGGANVSAFRRMPVPDDLRRLLDEDRRAAR